MASMADIVAAIGRLKEPPENFDLDTALQKGLAPKLDSLGNVIGHGASRDPETGRILKSIAHPTFDKAIEADVALGLIPFRDRRTSDIFTLQENPNPLFFEELNPNQLLQDAQAAREQQMLDFLFRRGPL